MKKQFFYYILLSFSFLFSYCAKDTVDFIPETGETINSKIFVTVVDEAGQPVQGANVAYLGQNYTTNNLGVVGIKNVKISNKHSVANISKSGYFTSTRVFSAHSSNWVKVQCVLKTKSFDKNFQANAGGEIITPDNVVLTFPANAIVYESSKQDYSGRVKVAVSYIDPLSETLFDEMPGNMSAITSDNRIDVLRTFGMVMVELETEVGEKLNIKSGQKVKMSVDIPSSMVQQATSTIKMWHFDESTGFWKEEGEAVKDGNKYVAEVSHFSSWNYDWNEPSVFAHGRVVDQNGNPISSAYVSIHNAVSDGGGHGNTSEDGTFGGRVPKDVNLKLRVYYYAGGCVGPIYEQNLNPLSVDTDLGDITVTVNLTQYSVSGNITDCDNNVVSTGAAVVYVSGNQSMIFPADDQGYFSGQILICNNSAQLNAKVVDYDNSVESSLIPLNAGTNDLGIVQACGNLIDYIKINIPDEGVVDFVINQNVSCFDSVSYKMVTGTSNRTNNEFSSVYFAYEDIGTIFNTGTFNLSSFNFFSSEAGIIGEFQLETMTITITQGGVSGNKLIGTFVGSVIGPNGVVPINGELRVTIP